jgi:UDP-3-O-[3-hydroxymyristoyl] glucosamine N-acyltransferase
VAGHLTIGAGVRLAARTGVTRNLEAGQTYGGAPAVPIRQWRRQVGAINLMAKRRGSKT